MASEGTLPGSDGTERQGVLASSSFDNASGSSKRVVLSEVFEDEDEASRHGATVALAGALHVTGPDGTSNGAGAVIPRQHQKKRNRKTPRSHKKRGSNSRTKSHSTRDGLNYTSKYAIW